MNALKKMSPTNPILSNPPGPEDGFDFRDGKF
jgi:hypothetical protein